MSKFDRAPDLGQHCESLEVAFALAQRLFEDRLEDEGRELIFAGASAARQRRYRDGVHSSAAEALERLFAAEE